MSYILCQLQVAPKRNRERDLIKCSCFDMRVSGWHFAHKYTNVNQKRYFSDTYTLGQQRTENEFRYMPQCVNTPYLLWHVLFFWDLVSYIALWPWPPPQQNISNTDHLCHHSQVRHLLRLQEFWQFFLLLYLTL